jgi:uncharacterized protein (UPF0276 family)
VFDGVIDRAGPRPSLIERDDQIPPLCELLAERAQAHAALTRHHCAQALPCP